MSKIPIGKKEKVNDIRTLWSKETEFSDWLVKEEGIALIAQDIGIEIEDPVRESKPGNFSCDIVAKMLGEENHVVVIENQFNKTDHDHLGKFLTYASVHKAMTGIWIAESVADDHRQVIDWLNENTPPTVNLYLAELKAFRIGDSPAAPQLNILCQPNNTQKFLRTDQSPAEIKLHLWRQTFWEEIHAHMYAHNPPFTLQKAGKDHWSSIALGRTGFLLDMLLTPKNKSVAISLIVQPEGWKDIAFEQLEIDKVAIEQEIGCPLQWFPLDGKKSSKIMIEAKIDPTIEGNRQSICEWFNETTPKMYHVFKSRIAALKSPD